MSGLQVFLAFGLVLAIGCAVGALLNFSRVIRAVFFRNVKSYFSGVLGYVFIVGFVSIAGLACFSSQFFTDNLLNLDHLTAWYPRMLLLIVPAITMAVWSDERKTGTDELLFTLPARDWEILAGKYLAVLAVYTIALAFSLLLWGWFAWLGEPDWGMMFSTYFGYWLAGAALLTAGMFGSVLTSSATVAYVYGVAICAIPVFIGDLSPSSEFLRGMTLSTRLQDFSAGTIPLTGVLYFVSFAALMLYLNLIFISRRHWSAGQQTNMGIQFVVRAAALLAVLISLNAIIELRPPRADMTAEKLFSLSGTTRTLIDRIDPKRPVTIQAFLSRDVPQEYLPVRKRLVGLLREYQRLGGGRIEVREVEVEPFSEQADEARSFAIQPKEVTTEREGRFVQDNVYLGAVVTSSYDEVVIPFFAPGTPVEYELTRSVRTVANEERKTVGILATDAGMTGSSNDWPIVSELKKQYKVEEVFPSGPIDDSKYDVLLAVLPSSLSQPQLQNLVDYVKKGRPTLIFDDPYPATFQGRNAPKQPKPRPGGMFGMGGPPPEPKADDGQLTTLLRELDLVWDNGRVAWDSYNPHLKYEFLPKEYLFISPLNGVKGAISQSSPITQDLQEIVMIYAGTLLQRRNSELEFEPLLRTSLKSGLLEWDDYTRESFDPFQMQSIRVPVRSPPNFLPPEGQREAHVLAYHVTSKKAGGVNTVFVADLDCISRLFFDLRDRGDEQLQFDNVAFVLNAVDVLAGDKAFLELRRRRSGLKTLEAFERRTREYDQDRRLKEKEADQEAKDELEAAKKRFEKQRDEITKDESLPEQTKQQMLESVAEAEQRRLDVAKVNIERDKQAKVDRIKAEMERHVRSEVNWLRAKAIATLPVPAILLGIVVLLLRRQGERKDIKAERMVRR